MASDTLRNGLPAQSHPLKRHRKSRGIRLVLVCSEGETGYFLRTSNCEHCSFRHKFRSVRVTTQERSVFVYLARIACGLRSGCFRSVARTAELVGGLPIIDLCYCAGRCCATSLHVFMKFVLRFHFLESCLKHHFF